MPVWLDAIPEQSPKVARPDTRRWLIFLFVLLVTVMVAGAWFWEGPREGIIFWFTLTGLPLCVWGLIFSLRRFAYKADQVGAGSWDLERQKLILSETRRGQQPAWILDSTIEILAGQEGATISAIISRAIPVLGLVMRPGKLSPVYYAALPQNGRSPDASQHYFIDTLTARIAQTLRPLREDLSCWLLIDCDTDKPEETVSALTDKLSEQTGRMFSRISHEGLAGLDSWMDRAVRTPSVLVVIAVHLPVNKQEGGADAITSVVLANRPSLKNPGAVRLHRPEKGNSSALDKTLSRALLWADTPADALSGGWITGKGLTQGSAWNIACETNEVTFSLTDGLVIPDHVTGYAGIAAPWLCITLAQSAASLGGSLAVATQSPNEKDGAWVMVVKQDEEQKGFTGNV